MLCGVYLSLPRARSTKERSKSTKPRDVAIDELSTDGKRRVRIITLILLTFNLLFWPTDRWLLADVPTAFPALGEGRLYLTICGLVIVGLSYQARWMIVALGWLAAGVTCGIIAWTLGRIGGPNTAWFQYIYPFLFLGLAGWLAPVARVAFTTYLGVVAVAAYILPSPQHVQDSMMPSAVGYLFFVVLLSILAGLYIDHLRIRAFVFGRGSARSLEQLVDRVATQTAHIQSLLDRVERAREQERREIAAELHDDMGQVLTGLRCQVRVAQAHADGADVLESQLADIAQLLQHGTRSFRAILNRMRPLVLDDLGLGAATEWLVDRTARLSNINGTLDLAPDSILAGLRADVSVVAFRVVQESLNNVVTHSGASEVSISILTPLGEAVLQVVIQDDGCGFEPADPSSEGIGIGSMKERARTLGGELTIRAAKGHGTRVELSLPLSGAADAPEAMPRV